MNMFNENQYLIERKRATLRPTYNIKDTNGNLLGYAKGQILKLDYRLEDSDGTCLGEVRWIKNRYEIYDAQNRIQATIKSASGQIRKSPWRIENSEGRQLAEIEQTSKFLRGEYAILASDKSVIALTHLVVKIPFLPGGKTPSYRLEILRQNLDPIVILSLLFFLLITSLRE